MVAGRTVRFESAPVSIETKNTFVHFASRDPLARRHTCTGALVSIRAKERRCASRSTGRAVTCAPGVAAVLVIPELCGKARRSSVDSASTDCSSSPCSQRLSFCDTPTESDFCCSPASFSQGLSQPCMPALDLSQLQYQSPQCSPQCSPQISPQISPQCSPRFAPSPCASPMMCQAMPQFVSSPMQMPCSPMAQYSPMQMPMQVMQMMPQYMSPLPSPRMQMPCSPMQAMQPMPQFMSPLPSPRSEPMFTEGWQPLQAASEAEGKKRSRRCKTVVTPPKETETTLLLRALPLDYTPDSLLVELKSFLQFIDFYYLPTNFETKKNLGYAFVNFTDKAAAARFKAFWEESGIPESEGSVQDARVQGFTTNVDKFRNSSVMAVLSADLKPRVFVQGVQQQFPEPAKKLPPVGPRFRPTGE